MIERIGPATLVVTEAELKLHCRIDEFQFEDERPVVMLYAAAAQDAAERITRRSIGVSTYQQTVDGQVSEVALQMTPLVSVQSVMSAGAAVAYTRSTEIATPVIRLASPADGVVVTYSAGYATVPESIRSWVLLRTGTLYEHREDNGEKPVAEHQFCRHLLTPYISRFVVA